MTAHRVADLMFELDQEIPAFARGFRFLCDFCGHSKRVHRAQGCRPNNRRCDHRCKRFLGA